MGGSTRQAAAEVSDAGVVLRPATEADLSQVESIELACFSTDPWPRQSFESFVGRPGVTFMVAEDGRGNGGIAGYGVLIRVLDEAELLNLAVSDRSRRRGIGSALIRGLLDAAAGQAVRTIYLEVRESNAAARALYRSHGFAEIGRRRGYYQRPVEDALILQKVEL